MANLELKTASGGSVTLVPEDGVDNVTATVKHESGVLASEQFVLSNDLGVGQTWQGFTNVRLPDVTYTNNTGKPIMVAVGHNQVDVNTTVRINNIPIAILADDAGGDRASFSFIVPDGHTYILERSQPIGTIQWAELR